VTVNAYQQGTLVVLSKPLDTRAKSLYLAYSIVFGITGAFFLSLLLIIYSSLVGGIVILAFGTGLLIASYRFGHAAMQQEEIFIDDKALFLITKGIKSKKRQVFELDAISNFRFLDKPRVERHALAGETFDYLGFQTEQQVINEMHGDNRLALDYEGVTVKFGKNVYSWEFDEIVELLKNAKGRAD